MSTEEQTENNIRIKKPQIILYDAVYLTNEAAELLRCQPSTIRRAVREGKISGKGRPFRIRGSELFKLT